MNCEQRYNNALKRARIGLHDCNLLDCDNMTRKAVITTIYHLFPELAEDEDEDEDERIRKGIIRNLQYLMDRSEGFVKEDLQERIAWLEKQGEFKSSKWTEGDVVRHGGVLALVTNGRKAMKSNCEQITIQYPDEWVKARTIFLARRTNDYYAMAIGILFNGKPTFKTILHESLHAVRMMLDVGLNIPFCDATEEVYAYLIGWIGDCIEDYLKGDGEL